MNRCTLENCGPWSVRFRQDLPEASPFVAREAIAGNDTRQRTRKFVAMSQEVFSPAFKGSPMKRPKLRGLKRNAAMALRDINNPEDLNVLTSARHDTEALVQTYATWALARIGSSAALEVLRTREPVKSDSWALEEISSRWRESAPGW